jgi:hypothetical protein
LASLQHNSALNESYGLKQAWVIYLGSWLLISNFLQEFRLQNCPITPKNGEKPLKIGLITIKTKKNSYKPTL